MSVKAPKAIPAEKLIEVLVAAAESKKATDIKIVNTQSFPSVADYFVICSAQNDSQMRAIDQEIYRKLAENKIIRPKENGVLQSHWMILDFGDVIMHIINPEQRAYYNLEALWNHAGGTYFYE